MQTKHKKHISKFTHLKIGDIPKKENSLIDDNFVVEETSDDVKNAYQENISVNPKHNSFVNNLNQHRNDKGNSFSPSDVPSPVYTHKKFDQTKPSTKVISDAETSFALPNFLQKVLPNSKIDENKISNQIMDKGIKMLPFSASFDSKNPNSFSYSFNREHEEVFGVQRVFKKSIAFLIFNIIIFSFLVIASLNFFSTSFFVTAIIAICYVVVSNIFFIIVADISYVFLSLFAQTFVLLIINSFIGLGFSTVTLVLVAIIFALIYLSYKDLEKVQLSSRLFSIAHITTESTRILTTVVILVLAMGVFNKAVYQGSESFVGDYFLNTEEPFWLDNILIGKYPNLSLNRVLMKGKFTPENNLIKTNVVKNNTTYKETAKFSDFLSQNFKYGEASLTEDRRDEILSNCDKKVVGTCDNLLNGEKNKNLENWRKEGYSKLPYTLETELTVPKFREVTRQFYLLEIQRFNSNSLTSKDSTATNGVADNLSKFLIVPKSYIIPAVFSLILLLILTITKPIFNWLAFLLTFLVWNILKLTGFVKIDIENVEAEIVGI